MSDFEKRLKESKNEIIDSQINNPKEIYQKAVSNKKTIFKFNYNLFLKFAMIVLMIITISISGVAIHKSNQEKPIVINPIINIDTNNFNELLQKDEMMQFSNKKQIETLIKASSISLDFVYDLSEDVNVSPEVGAPKGDSGVDSDREYNTNIQEENVDEADIVKVNGNYIYYIPYSSYSSYYSDESYKKLYVLKAEGNSLKKIKEINYVTESKELGKDENAIVTEYKTTQPKDLFYTDKYIILRLEATIYDQIKYGNRESRSNYRYYTEFAIFNIINFKLEKNIVIPGTFVSSRLINDELYIISNYTSMKSDNMYIPRYYIDGVMEEASLDDIYYNPIMGTNLNSYVIVFKLKLDDNIKIDQFYFISPRISNVYMTENNLYLLRKSTYTNDVDENKKVQFPLTQILVINIQDGIIAKGVISVVGNVSDKYWIDEYEGYLRVASTGTQYISKILLGKYYYDQQSEVFNRITIFELDDSGKYKEISTIQDGIGEPGESMKSARFEGDVATIVTFKQTDPLYYIDLSDPYNPKITSELKVSGFTVYQHPYKDNYVIGIGYEADSNGGTTGYKVALFDISNKKNIKQVGQSIVFNDNYTNLSVLSNPKELMLDLENDIFGFNIMKYDYSKINRYTYHDKFYTFKIDLNRENPLYIFSEYSINSDYKGIIDRMVFIKDKYYLLASSEVHIFKLTKNKLNYLSKFALD